MGNQRLALRTNRRRPLRGTVAAQAPPEGTAECRATATEDLGRATTVALGTSAPVSAFISGAMTDHSRRHLEDQPAARLIVRMSASAFPNAAPAAVLSKMHHVGTLL